MGGAAYKKLSGKMVECVWADPSGFINEDLSEVRLSKCTTWGILKEVRGDCIVIQTSSYEGALSPNSEHGDYTVITKGCITTLREYKC